MRIQSTSAASAKAGEFNRPVIRMAVRLGTAALVVSLLGGCAGLKRDHVVVGSIPDDYRTNHPIVLQESEQTVDIPVASADRELVYAHKDMIEGFVAGYRESGSGAIKVLVPVGSANAAAAGRIGNQVVKFLQTKGAANGYVHLEHYDGSGHQAAPVRISYVAMTAQTGKCGRWPEDVLVNPDNKHYANFGCAYQNNLAAMLQNPADLLNPRGRGEIDAERRGAVIDNWRAGGSGLDSSVNF